MTWDEYYEKVYTWAPSTLVRHMSSLESFGDPDEVAEAITEIAWEDEQGANRLFKKAIAAGVQFSAGHLCDFSLYCEEDLLDEAALLSADRMSEKDLEELYGVIRDETIEKIAAKGKKKLPGALRGDAPDVEELIESASWAHECLLRAQDALNDSLSLSAWDTMGGGFFTSLFKHRALSAADAELREARVAVEDLSDGLNEFLSREDARLSFKALTGFVDIWMDDNFLDCLVHLQISKARKNIARAIRQVEDIHRELLKLR